MSKKKPVSKAQPFFQKTPRGGEKAKPTEETLSWHIRILDEEGPYGWQRVDLPTLRRRILSRMASFETMTWPEILGHHHHAITLDKLCLQARKRLAEIKQEDIPELISLALSGRERLWGVRDRNIFKILWWDPNHQVCPSHKG